MSFRQFISFAVVLVTLSSSSFGLRLPIKRVATSKPHVQQSQSSGLSKRATDISQNQHATIMHNDRDLTYTVDVKIGGQDVEVLLDTGSADFWVKNPQIQITETTLLTANLSYAIGSVSGSVDYAPVKIAGFSIPSQVFLNVQTAQDMGSTSSFMGLGFDTTSSFLHKLIIDEFGTNQDPRRSNSPLFNIFSSNLALPNFFTFLLGRLDDPDDEQGGIFTIGEYIEEFASVANSPKLVRQTNDRWTVVVDGVTINGKNFPLSSSQLGVPSGKAIASLDSGFSLPPLPADLVDAIYASVPGAMNVEGLSVFDAAGAVYLVPCTSPIANVSFIIGGVEFPVHPLDLNKILTDNNTTTVCRSTLRKFNLDPAQERFDMILGDVFLRNAYTSFNYGSLDGMHEEFTAVREKQLERVPKEEDLSQLKAGGTTSDSKPEGSKPEGSAPPASASQESSPKKSAGVSFKTNSRTPLSLSVAFLLLASLAIYGL
ncbi:hypothetical protein ONZ45_g4783 [Pleurotus djamor]|nr:hypothetical protein ONZ45_g4783 [Pleurotus djamor]